MADKRDHTGGCLGCATVIALIVGLAAGFMVMVAPSTVGITLKAYAERTLGNMGVQTSSQSSAKQATEMRSARVEEYARGLLNERQREAYDQILEGVCALQDQIAVVNADSNDVTVAFKAMMNDHPELFWLDGSFVFSYSSLMEAVVVEPGFEIDLAEVEPTRQAIEAVADAALAPLGEKPEDYDVARVAYEFIATTTDYDLEADHNQTIQSVFLGRKSVCAGYARAYQYLMHRAGRFCAYVEGKIVSRNEEHAWNLVRIAGKYAYVDPTWADPTYLGEEEGVPITGVIYDYLCLTTDEIKRDDHAFANESIWPLCGSVELDYYRWAGLFFEDYDPQRMAEAFWHQVDTQGNMAAFKFGTDEAYAQALSDLENGVFLRDELLELASQLGQNSIRYSYSSTESLRIVKLYW